MLSQTGALLEAGLALKVRQLKLAVRSYLDDRTAQGKGAVTSYVTAVGLFAGAAVFLLAACFVGVIALYRWLAITYGQFIAFGCIGALFVILTAICVGLALAQLHRKTRSIPTLSKRLIGAVKANPVRLPHAGDKGRARRPRDTAALARSATFDAISSDASSSHRGQGRSDRPAQHSRDGRALLLVAATVLGWAVARNRRRARSAEE